MGIKLAVFFIFHSNIKGDNIVAVYIRRVSQSHFLFYMNIENNMAVCDFASATRRKNFKYELVYFTEGKQVCKIKTSSIEDFDYNYVSEGDMVTVAWPVGKLLINHEAKVTYLQSKYVFSYFPAGQNLFKVSKITLEQRSGL